jgi:hypothetical protein
LPSGAIAALPGGGNKELAALLSESPDRKVDKLEVTALNISAQKQALKKAEGEVAAPAKKPGRRAKVAPETNGSPALVQAPPHAASSPVGT